MAEFEDALQGTFEQFIGVMPHIEHKTDDKGRLVCCALGTATIAQQALVTTAVLLGYENQNTSMQGLPLHLH
jgi:hypothetical protein